ncbi:MAG: DHH family phosphoesterase [Candidatus Nanohaloarchaeota archaeon QJJ-5]|nr:DHH family phosphoesterase [Candidatus Nanohaloarchaeota archaeon QJJ-5]
MDQQLTTSAAQIASFLKDHDDILCVSHYDCDGISSAVIVREMLEREDKQFDQVFLDELTEEKLASVVTDHDHETVLLTDFGSGQLPTVNTVLDHHDVAIIDHHEPSEDGTLEHHCNPHLVGIDGGSEISGAGMTYVVARELDQANIDLSPYALIGATGDMQRDGDTYQGLNQEIVEEAQKHDHITIKQGLKLYGRRGRNLVKALTYTTDPYLSGITDNESGAVQFLRSIGIELSDENGEWRSLADLSLEEERMIVNGLIKKGYGDIEQLIGSVYILDNGWEIREFASLMNACGRLDRPADGVTIAREDDFDLAATIKRKYSRKIGRYLSFVEDNMDDTEVIQEIGPGTLIQADDSIHANMIGTIASICIRSDILDDPIIIGMAHKGEDAIKISARASSEVTETGLAMSELMETCCTTVGGEGGGHERAAGGKIPRTEQERFIKVIREELTESLSKDTLTHQA